MREARARPELGPVQSGLNEQLRMVEARFRAMPSETPRSTPLPDLRGRLSEAARGWGDDPEDRDLANELDEIVDAVNGLAAVAGLHPDDDEPAT